MNLWTALAFAIVLLLPAIFIAVCLGYLLIRHSREFQHFFETPPALVAPEAEPLIGNEIRFRTKSGRQLAGTLLAHRGESCQGVIVFCHEFTGTRHLAMRYTDFLLEAGFDVFAFDFCNHGESDSVEGYEPMQWVTEHEVEDVSAAVQYAYSQFPAARDGLGIYGISKGGSAGAVVASRTGLAKAIVIDGAYPTHSVVAGFARRWVHLVAPLGRAIRSMPQVAYRILTAVELMRIGRRRNCRFPRVETSLRNLSRYPLLVIHGKRDRYISVDIVKKVFSTRFKRMNFWIVPNAKHNRCIDVAGDDYRNRVTDFFETYLAVESPSRGLESVPRESGNI